MRCGACHHVSGSLLAGRPPGGDVPDLDLNYLTAAGLGASHLTAYVRVTEQLGASER